MAPTVSRRALLSALLAGSTAGCVGSLGNDSGSGDDPSENSSDGDSDAGGDSTGSDGGDSTGSASDGESDGSTAAAVDGADVERRIHELVNDERTSRDLASLSWDGRVQNVADAHSADMLVRDFFAHENPDGEGVQDRFAAQGVTDCQAVGENIAQTWWDTDVETEDGVEHYTTVDGLAEAVVEDWMDSEEHRANVLGEDWASEGVGVEITVDGKVLVTQNFCG